MARCVGRTRHDRVVALIGAVIEAANLFGERRPGPVRHTDPAGSCLVPPGSPGPLPRLRGYYWCMGATENAGRLAFLAAAVGQHHTRRLMLTAPNTRRS